MEFFVGNEIKAVNADRSLFYWCRDNLVLDNPDYLKKERMGKWTGNIPRTIELFECVGREIHIPFGCLKRIFDMYGGTCNFKPLFAPLRAVSYKSDISPYPYQEVAINKALRARNGIIVMPCGAGKTQTGLELISRIGGRCLWLTHTQDLLNQSMNRAKSCFGLPLSEYGTITGGKVNIKSITFATVQTMCKLDLTKYRYEFDVIVVDECHKCVGGPTKVMQFYKVLSNLSARYKYGLTATPRRNDGLEASMFSLIGGIIHEVPKSEVKGTTCKVIVKTFNTGYIPDLDVVLAGDGTINYASLVDDMIHNEMRFRFVDSIINSYAVLGPTLVLGNRVEYLERLSKSFKGKAVCLSTMGVSKKAKEERKKILKMLNDGEVDCVFATYQLAKEGLDVPRLKCVVLATPEKDETTVTQATGRVGRKSNGKDYGIVIDFDDNFGMYKGWAKKRNRIYKKLDYEVEE